MQAVRAFPTDFILLHVPNESFTTKIFRIHLAQIGVYAGAPDYLVLSANGWAAIEFKRDFKSRQTFNQKAFQAKCEELGKQYFLTHDIRKAIDFLMSI